MAEGFIGKIQAVLAALRKKSTDQDIRNPQAEEASKLLPEAVMPRGALAAKRKQLRDIDAQTKED
jgi:predicted carbohydrate-binding protein with CBM5 and CBM33 domain